MPTVPTTIPADSGLGSTAPSEIVDPEANELTSSQEESLTLDAGLGSYRKSEIKNGGVAIPLKTTPTTAMPLRSATVESSPKTTHDVTSMGEGLSSLSEGSLLRANNHVLPPPHNLVTMVSASSGSGASIAVEAGEE